MNKIITMALSLALASAAAVAAPGPERMGLMRGEPAAGPMQALRDHLGPPQSPDAKGQDQGVRMAFRRVFAKVDANEDGLISLEEFLAKPAEFADRRFDRLDANDDGSLSPEEFDARRPGAFRFGWVDRDEFRACVAEHLDADLPPIPDRDAIFADLDTENSGGIDKDEFSAAHTERMTERFNRIDTNADGSLTREELAAAFKNVRERRLVHRLCIEEQRDLEDLYSE